MSTPNFLVDIPAKKHRVLLEFVYASPNDLTGKSVDEASRCMQDRGEAPHLRKAVDNTALEKFKRIDSKWWHFELPEVLENPLIVDDRAFCKRG